jgi:spermidine synthase
MPRLALYLLFLTSGICGLVYEVLWVRTLGLVLGVTVYATSTVLAAYMAGLAAGSFAFGRLVDRKTHRPLVWYGILEIAVAATALVTSLVFIGLSKPGAPVLATPLLYALAAALLFIPTFLMGGTLPVIGRYLIADVKESGKFTGALYGINTLGGMLGCLLAGFVLVSAFGVQQSIIYAALLNALIGTGVLALGRKTQPVTPAKQSDAAPSEGARIPETTSPEARFAPVLLVLYAISGFCSLGYEVLWTRALMFSFGNDTFAFSLMLGTFLLGLGLGSALLSRYVNRFRNAVVVLGLLQIIIGLAVFGGTDLLYRMDAIVDWVWQRSGQNWFAAMAARFLSAVLLMAGPTMAIGALLPVANRIYSSARRSIGQGIGNLYAANTVGTILGSLVAGFVLIPFLGITRSILLLSVVNVALGIACFAFQPRRAWLWVGVVLAIGLIPASTIYLSRAPFPLHAAGIARLGGPSKLLYYKEGATASVAVMQDPQGMKMLGVNGVYTAYTNVGDLQVHYLLGYLPYFLCPEPKDALVIGMGLGVTSASLQATGMRVDCVELAKEEIGASPFLADVNGGILSKPNFSLIIGDGRHHLQTTAKRYDVITANAVHVRLSPYLYTQEFYELCKRRLRPHGVVCQWLPVNNLPGKEFKQLIRACQVVFPNTSVWYVNPGHFLLVGSDDPLAIPYGQLAGRCLQPAVQAQLKTVYLENPAVITSLCMLDARGTAAFTGTPAPHSDDKPCAEFVRVLETRKALDLVTVPENLWADIPALLTDVDDSTKATLTPAFEAGFLSRRAELAGWRDDYEQAVGLFQQALTIYPADTRTGFLLQDGTTMLKAVYLNLANQALARKQSSETAALLGKVLAIDSGFAPAYTHLGLLYSMQRRPDSAIVAFRKAISLQASDPAPYVHLGSVYIETGDLLSAADQFRQALQADPQCAMAFFGLGCTYAYRGDRQSSRDAFGKAFKYGLNAHYRQIAENLMQRR